MAPLLLFAIFIGNRATAQKGRRRHSHDLRVCVAGQAFVNKMMVRVGAEDQQTEVASDVTLYPRRNDTNFLFL